MPDLKMFSQVYPDGTTRAGQPVSDPVHQIAVAEGTWYVSGPKGDIFLVDYEEMARRRLLERIPFYHQWTERQMKLYYKVCNDAFMNMRVVKRILGTPSIKKTIEWLDFREVPFYLLGGNNPRVLGVNEKVFIGDFVRALEACEVVKYKNAASPEEIIPRRYVLKRANSVVREQRRAATWRRKRKPEQRLETAGAGQTAQRDSGTGGA